MPAYPANDPLFLPQPLGAEPNRDFWLHGLGFAGFFGVMNLGAGLDDAWKKAFGSGQNREIASELLVRTGDARHARRNLLLAAAYVEKTDTEALADVARALLGDRAVPDENTRQFCRNGLAARILAVRPAALIGVRALDEFGPRRHYALALDGHRAPPPAPLPLVDWPEVAGRALDALIRERRSLNLRACVPRPWRHDVILAFREEGRSAPNWKEGKAELQLGNKLEWTWVRLLDGGHRAEIAGHDVERGVTVASAVATALWGRERTYGWACDPLTPERLQVLHEALINPHEHKFKLLEIVAEMPGLHNRPILKLGNTGQERVELALADLWNADVGFARDPTHVLRAKVSFLRGKRKYRIELHYPEDAMTDEPIVGFGTVGVHPDVAEGFAKLVRDELGIVLHPRSPADDAPRSAAWAERPAKLLAKHWDRLLAPTVLAPAPWERRELDALVRRKVVTTRSEAVFRCGSPAILKRAHGAPDGCTGTVIGEFGGVNIDVPFLQPPGDALACDRCGALWPRQRERLPWKERLVVGIDSRAAWEHVVGLLRERAKAADRSTVGVFGWYEAGKVFEVIGVEGADPDRRRPARAAGRHAAWFGTSASALAPYGDRSVSLADVMAEEVAAFDRVFALGPVPGTPERLYLSEPPPAMYATGGPRIGSPTHKGIIQRGDDGAAYLHQRVVVKAASAMLILTLAAIQKATEEAGRDDDDRGWFAAGDIAAVIHEELKLSNGGNVPSELHIADARIHTWVNRLREEITAANVPAVTGADVIETGNTKGIRLGARFRLDGFSVQDEARAYKMKPQRPRASEKG